MSDKQVSENLQQLTTNYKPQTHSMAIVAPSFLASNFLRLEEECKMVNNSEAEWFHLDVMDGVFVPNISFGLPVIEHIRKTTNKICDVHLMIVEPGKYAADFKKAGAMFYPFI